MTHRDRHASHEISLAIAPTIAISVSMRMQIELKARLPQAPVIRIENTLHEFVWSDQCLTRVQHPLRVSKSKSKRKGGEGGIVC